jgi:hypothetical protein
MALIQWKQIDPHLSGSANLTGSLNVTGSIVLNNFDLDIAVDSSIFRRTGSFYATTTDLEVTGSLRLSFDGISDYFSVSVGGEEKFKINEEGVAVFTPQADTPTAVSGGLFYSSSDAYYLGFSN